jgi:CheY-like chemotaxis protein
MHSIMKNDSANSVDIRVLLSSANLPTRKLFVSVVDDQPHLVSVIIDILSHWPNIEVELIVPSGNEIPVISLESDIVLLDHMLGPRLSGDEVAMSLRERGFTGTIASISSSRKPLYAVSHFPSKASMDKPESCLRFMQFMNVLVSR